MASERWVAVSLPPPEAAPGVSELAGGGGLRRVGVGLAGQLQLARWQLPLQERQVPPPLRFSLHFGETGTVCFQLKRKQS